MKRKSRAKDGFYRMKRKIIKIDEENAMVAARVLLLATRVRSK